jgi:hypothetical protein
MGGSQPGEGGLGHPWATYMHPKLFLLLACLMLTLILSSIYPEMVWLNQIGVLFVNF